MEADKNPKDFWGNPMKKGNLVLIYDGTTTGLDNNKIYVYMNPGWEFATYLDAGYPTRQEFSELGSEVSGLSGFTQYGYINPTTGTIANSSTNKNLFVNTGYVKISNNGDIVLCGDTANQYNNALAFYDADKKYISGISNVTADDTKRITILSENIPINARYIVASEKVASKNKAYLSYPSFVELSSDYIIDCPRGNNLYNKFYADVVIDDNFVNNKIYKLRAVKRDREQNVLTLSNNSSKWNVRILFYDVDNVLLRQDDLVEGTLDIPSTCDYIAFEVYGYTIRNNDDLMVNYGGEALPFEEFNSSIGYYTKVNQLAKSIANTLSINAYNFGLNGYIANNGSVVDPNNNDAFRCTSLLHIAKESELWYKGDSSNQYNNVIAFYDVNKNFISALSNIDEEGQEQIHRMPYSELPKGTRYIRVCRKKEDLTAFVSYTPNEQAQFDYIIDIPRGNNLYNINNKYTELSNSSLYFLPTAILRDANQEKLIVSQRNSGYYLHVHFYDAEYSLIHAITDLLVGGVADIPKTCKYIVFRDYGHGVQSGGTMVNYGEEILPYEDYNTILVKKEVLKTNPFFSTKSDNLTSGSLSIDVPNVKYNQTIGFLAKVNSFGKITLSHGKSTYAAGLVDIDGTNITTYTTVPHVEGIYPHGLSINTYIEVLISQTDTTTAMLRIRTLGGEFSKEIPFNGSRDNVLCEVENCNLSDCLLTHTSSDYKKEVWAFGDSYFDYLPPRLKEIGYNNALFDAFSGRNSADALKSLKKMIGVVGIPKIIYWALGMNDGDSDSSVNSSWDSAFNELRTICENYSVELILATIPNVSKVNNRFKNEIVRNSGYRYVDNNMCVGADMFDDWYNGLIGSDKLHPSSEGAKVLANGLAISIPELKI
jgi:lysophospholipase L1-like esterase